MRKLLIGLLLCAATAWGVSFSTLECEGRYVGNTDAVAPDDVTPSVATGNTFVTGINTGATAITDLDNPTVGAYYALICGSIAGGFQSTIADAGNFTLNGAWNPATVGDSITLYCFADNDYREVSRSYAVPGPVQGDPFQAGADAPGNPGYQWIGDPDTGWQNPGADSIGGSVGGAQVFLLNATGITADRAAGDTGTVIPGYGMFTDIWGSGEFYFGQTPPDLHTGYKDRSDYITFQDDFTVSVDTEYILDWDLTTVVGGGTNTVSVRPGWSELVTGGAGVDSESTRSWGLSNYRAYAPRMESVIDLTNLVTQRFEWGFWAAANEYVCIVYDVALGVNWYLEVQDTVDTEQIDSGVAVTVDPTKLEIVVDAAGNVTWAIDDVAMTVVGLTNLMTANPHYTWWELTDTAAAAHTVAVDYVQIEQLKQQ